MVKVCGPSVKRVCALVKREGCLHGQHIRAITAFTHCVSYHAEVVENEISRRVCMRLVRMCRIEHLYGDVEAS